MLALAPRFVLAADEVWRLQRSDDPEARFFQPMADQGHYRGKGGTRQGIYLLAPSGELLASVNTLDAARVRTTLELGLAAWAALPAERRLLDTADELQPGHRWEWSRPQGGLVLGTVARDMTRDTSPHDEPAPKWNRDFVWYSRDEARRFVPVDTACEVGAAWSVPRDLAERLARYHLVDNARGQTLPFAPEEVERAELRLEVTAREGDLLTLELSGTTAAEARGPWLLGENDWTPEIEWPRRVESVLLGSAAFDLANENFTAFDVVALADWEGRTRYNGRGNETRGRVGLVLQLAGDSPAERVAPAFIDLYDADWVR